MFCNLDAAHDLPDIEGRRIKMGTISGVRLYTSIPVFHVSNVSLVHISYALRCSKC